METVDGNGLAVPYWWCGAGVLSVDFEKWRSDIGEI
jgi:hypothetical protein